MIHRGLITGDTIPHSKLIRNADVRRMAARVDSILRKDWREPLITEPRGITICAGGPTYFVSAYLLVRLLRYHKCNLPIQLWHVGRKELDLSMRRLVSPYGVECVDATKFFAAHPVARLAGWPLKPYAIIHSPFREVLALDADNFPCRDPSYLFGYSEYSFSGAIFWPDVGRTEPERLIWKVMRVPFVDEPEFESGQIVVDKLKCWEPLNLAMWMNENSSFFYRIIHGDKDTFRFAWRRYGRSFSMTAMPVQLLTVKGGACCGGVMCQHDLEGYRLFQHRNLYKWRLHQYNPQIAGFLFEGLCRAFLEELRLLWTGRVDHKWNPRARSSKPDLNLCREVWVVRGVEDSSSRSATAETEDRANTPTRASGLASGDVGSNTPALPEWTFKQDGVVLGPQDSRLAYWRLGKRPKTIEVGDGREVHLVLNQKNRKATVELTGRYKHQVPPRRICLRRLEDEFPALDERTFSPSPFTGVKRKPASLHLFNSAKGIGDHVVALYSCIGIANSGYRVIFHTQYCDWFVRVSHPGVTISDAPAPTLCDRVPSQKKGAIVSVPFIDLNYNYQMQLRRARDKARWYSASVSTVARAPLLPPARPKCIRRAVQVQPFDFSNYILLVPFAAWTSREWPICHWTRLAQLLTEKNYHVVAIGLEKDEARLQEAFDATCAMWVTGKDPAWVLDAMLEAEVTIGGDSGMIHVAGLMGVPAICLHAHLPREFLFSCATSVVSLTPKTKCAFCRWQHDRGYTTACDAGCSALATVGPEDVLACALQKNKKEA